MAQSNQDHNIILLPKTVDFYQAELTRLLEEERYKEAARLLRFLLECRYDDSMQREEWKMLLTWLQTHTGAGSGLPDGQGEEAEESEEELLRILVQSKSLARQDYAENLLKFLSEPHSTEQQMAALEQLAYADHPEIESALISWLERQQLHPHLQFRVLQILKRRGFCGQVAVLRNGDILNIDVQSVPNDFNDFPQNIRDVLARMQPILEIHYPALSEYAEQMWIDFLIFLFGTEQYAQLAAANDEQINVWAGALHFHLTRTMFGETEERETKKLYGITEEWDSFWEKAQRMIGLWNKP